jgi:hypothetical protein
MKKPANAGAHGLSKSVFQQVDTDGYAPAPSALQAQTLARRFGLSASVAAVKAEHCFGVPESWRGAR